MERNNIMNRKLYKMQQISERLWILAANTALIAAALGKEGRGFAIVAEETRKMTNKMQHLVEEALFEDKEVEVGKMKEAAQEIMLLALNAAIEAHRLHINGKQAAVCAEGIRTLAYMLTTVISDDIPLDKLPDTIIPWPKTPLTTVISDNTCFILLKTGDVHFVENLINITMVCYGLTESKDGIVILRGAELSVIKTQNLLNIESDKPMHHVILRTPWAEDSKEYAVAVDSIGYIFYSPIGTPVAPPIDMPLAQYVRECWENENGEPFYFMDWTKMVK
jgi:hypothetical protein